MENNKVVYRHIRNDTNKVFYVGMGNIKRASVRAKRTNHWTNIVNKAGYTIDIVAKNLSIDDANELEIFMIDEYGIDNLCNVTLGGGGGKGTKYWLGKHHSDETKLKCSEANKNNSYHLGHKNTESIKKNMSEIKKGTRHSQVTKDKISSNSTVANKVIDKSTGITYTSVRKGAEALCRNYSTIEAQMNGRKNRQEYNTLFYI